MRGSASIVEVADGPLAGARALDERDLGREIDGGFVGPVEEAKRRMLDLARGRAIVEDHGAPAVSAVEPISDPGVLEHARNEREVALTVLHAELPLFVGGAVGEDSVLDAPFAEHLRDDLELGLVLEDAVVRAEREEMGARLDRHLVGREPIAIDFT